MVGGDKNKAALGDLVHAALREVLWTENGKREKATREQGGPLDRASTGTGLIANAPR